MKSITVIINYDDMLQNITGVKREKATVSEDLPFVHMLNFVFTSYPEMMKKYPPGVLGFSINGEPPSEFDLMHDGDTLELKVYTENLPH